MTTPDQLTLLHRSRRTKKHAHRFVPDYIEPTIERCDLCGIWKAEYEARQRRGRLANQRGKRIQRQRNVALGLRNLAGNNINLDGMSGMFASESKSGGAFSERYWRWLKGIKLINADQVPILIVTDTPGSARKARSVVVLDYEDWKALHQETEDLG